MSYLKNIRERIENILTGNFGYSGYTVQTGRFVSLADYAGDIEEQYHSTVERTFEIEFDPRTAEYHINNLDGFGIFNHKFTISIGYQRTNMGNENSEGLTQLNGAGTVKAIRDRALTDEHDIERVLVWYENYSGLSPEVMDITKDNGTFTEGEDRCTLSLSFTMQVYASLANSYV